MIKKFLVIAVFGGIGLTSCKKTYTCECTTKLGSYESKQSSSQDFSSQKKAEANCADKQHLDSSPTVTCVVL